MMRPRTPWAVICPEHGRVYLTEEECNAQHLEPDPWRCPICQTVSEFDRSNWLRWQGLPPDLEPFGREEDF